MSTPNTQADPDREAELWQKELWSAAWEACISRAFHHDAVTYFSYQDADLQSALLQATRCDLLGRLDEYRREAGLSKHIPLLLKTVIWIAPSGYGGPRYQPATGGGSSGSHGSHGSAIGTIDMEVQVRGLLELQDIQTFWAHGYDQEPQLTMTTKQVPDVRLSVSISPPSRSFEDAVNQGVTDAVQCFRTAHDINQTQIDATSLVSQGTAHLRACQSELDHTWGLAGRDRRNSVVWYTASCTLEFNESEEFILKADLGGWHWQGAEEQELERQTVTQVL